MPDNGITTADTTTSPAGGGLMGWLAGWLQSLAAAEEASLQLREDQEGNLATDRDQRDEDLHFAAFMTGPLY